MLLLLTLKNHTATLRSGIPALQQASFLKTRFTHIASGARATTIRRYLGAKVKKYFGINELHCVKLY